MMIALSQAQQPYYSATSCSSTTQKCSNGVTTTLMLRTLFCLQCTRALWFMSNLHVVTIDIKAFVPPWYTGVEKNWRELSVARS
jgi:hypothetical protein